MLVYYRTTTFGSDLMPRQSVSLTAPNNDWLTGQVESGEYASKSEVVNDLIRKAREIEAIRARLVAAEQSGFTDVSRAQILRKVRGRVRQNEDVST
jgi:antitoxin ParD1/3/4